MGGDSNPRYLLGKHAFQACALDHSATHPEVACTARAVEGAQILFRNRKLRNQNFQKMLIFFTESTSLVCRAALCALPP